MKACLCRRWGLDLRPRALLSTGPAEGYSLLGFHCLENKGEEEVDLPGQAFLPSLTRRSQHHRLCCLHRIATTNMVVIGKKMAPQSLLKPQPLRMGSQQNSRSVSI